MNAAVSVLLGTGIVAGSVLTIPARAQSLTYTCEGEIFGPTAGSPPAGHWAGAQVGDRFVARFRVANPLPSAPVTELYVQLAAAHSSALTNSSFVLTDDFFDGFFCIDRFALFAEGLPGYPVCVLELEDWESSGCPGLVLAGPPSEVDLAQFTITIPKVRLMQPLSGNPQIRCDIESIEVASGGPGSFVDVCNGDGGVAPGCTPCPCGNSAPAGTLGGCLNSAGRTGLLAAGGSDSVAAANLQFTLLHATPSSFGVLLSGSAVAPTNPASPCFGLPSGITSVAFDGLRCAVGSVQRHGTRATNADGMAGADVLGWAPLDPPTPNAGWGPPDGPAGGIPAQGGFASGTTRVFQTAYRESIAAGCGTGVNTTQGIVVLFRP